MRYIQPGHILPLHLSEGTGKTSRGLGEEAEGETENKLVRPPHTSLWFSPGTVCKTADRF